MAKKRTSISIKRAARIIKKYEGFMPEPYRCPGGIPTIGYGSTRYENGDEVSMDDCSIDRERAEEILLYYIKEVADQVRSVVKHKLEDHQEAALISFTYNLGIGNLKRSTLLQLINRGPENQNIPNEFRRWNKAGGKVLAGLTTRREEEAKLWSNA
jgi:lysozyme